jgi:ribosome-binding protein aMBF1 (putative translation factor)
MARFIGTIDDYEKYIGPRIKNVVNTFAKSERDSRNRKCEFCGKNAELESAHKHGKERKQLIKEALKKYDNGTYFDVDVEKCEHDILELHNPINSVFYFLCRECHRKYDSNNSQEIIVNTQPSMENDAKKEYSNNKPHQLQVNKNDDEIVNEINKIERRIKGWFLNREQKNSKILYAFIKIYEENNGIVEYNKLKETAGITKFDLNFNQMKNFGSQNHGKIFDQVGDKIYLWDKVEQKIWNYYKHFKK